MNQHEIYFNFTKKSLDALPSDLAGLQEFLPLLNLVLCVQDWNNDARDQRIQLFPQEIVYQSHIGKNNGPGQWVNFKYPCLSCS